MQQLGMPSSPASSPCISSAGSVSQFICGSRLQTLATSSYELWHGQKGITSGEPRMHWRPVATRVAQHHCRRSGPILRSLPHSMVRALSATVMIYATSCSEHKDDGRVRVTCPLEFNFFDRSGKPVSEPPDGEWVDPTTGTEPVISYIVFRHMGETRWAPWRAGMPGPADHGRTYTFTFTPVLLKESIVYFVYTVEKDGRLVYTERDPMLFGAP